MGDRIGGGRKREKDKPKKTRFVFVYPVFLPWTCSCEDFLQTANGKLGWKTHPGADHKSAVLCRKKKSFAHGMLCSLEVRRMLLYTIFPPRFHKIKVSSIDRGDGNQRFYAKMEWAVKHNTCLHASFNSPHKIRTRLRFDISVKEY